jgi:hypothetical protein
MLRSQDQGKILIAKNLEVSRLSILLRACSAAFVGFAANCVPFFIEENTRDSSDLFSLNPTSWQRQEDAHQSAFSLSAKMLINSSTRLMVAGDAPSALLLVDTENPVISLPWFRSLEDSYSIRCRWPGSKNKCPTNFSLSPNDKLKLVDINESSISLFASARTFSLTSSKQNPGAAGDQIIFLLLRGSWAGRASRCA